MDKPFVTSTVCFWRPAFKLRCAAAAITAIAASNTGPPKMDKEVETELRCWHLGKVVDQLTTPIILTSALASF